MEQAFSPQELNGSGSWGDAPCWHGTDLWPFNPKIWVIGSSLLPRPRRPPAGKVCGVWNASMLGLNLATKRRVPSPYAIGVSSQSPGLPGSGLPWVGKSRFRTPSGFHPTASKGSSQSDTAFRCESARTDPFRDPFRETPSEDPLR